MAMKEHGMDKRTAIIDAAHKRARPIPMTTVAMGAGMLPTAIGLGAEVEFRAPMAIAVIGGLITSTLLSLLYIPVVFILMDGLKTRSERLMGADLRRPPPRGGGEEGRGVTQILPAMRGRWLERPEGLAGPMQHWPPQSLRDSSPASRGAAVSRLQRLGHHRREPFGDDPRPSALGWMPSRCMKRETPITPVKKSGA
ncbi:efflux RND transporter permease subunit [Caulobacter segnis]